MFVFLLKCYPCCLLISYRALNIIKYDGDKIDD